MHGPNTGFALPQGWVRLYSPGWWSCRVVLTVVDLVHIGDRDLPPPILEPLENLLGCDFSAVAEDVGVVEEAQDLIGNLYQCQKTFR